MHAFDRQTDGQTDRQTDRNLIVRPRLLSMQRGKKTFSDSTFRPRWVLDTWESKPYDLLSTDRDPDHYITKLYEHQDHDHASDGQGQEKDQDCVNWHCFPSANNNLTSLCWCKLVVCQTVVTVERCCMYKCKISRPILSPHTRNRLACHTVTFLLSVEMLNTVLVCLTSLSVILQPLPKGWLG